MARLVHRARHDGGDAAHRASRLWIRRPCGSRSATIRRGLTVKGKDAAESAGVRRIRVHLPETRSRQHRHRLRARNHYLDAVDCPPLRAAANFRQSSSQSGHRRRRIGAAQLHAVSDPASAARSAGPRGVACCSPGDAGGFVNGFTAEGIYRAMVSGDLAARAVLDSPRGFEPALARIAYRRACRTGRSEPSCATRCSFGGSLSGTGEESGA